MTLSFDERTKHEFVREKDGHIYIDAQIVCEGSSDSDTVYFIYDTRAFTPESPLLKQNLLGNNVIEYFRPFQDNMNDAIYFPENLNPKPFFSEKHGVSLACDGLFLIGDD